MDPVSPVPVPSNVYIADVAKTSVKWLGLF